MEHRDGRLGPRTAAKAGKEDAGLTLSSAAALIVQLWLGSIFVNAEVAPPIATMQAWLRMQTNRA